MKNLLKIASFLFIKIIAEGREKVEELPLRFLTFALLKIMRFA